MILSPNSMDSSNFSGHQNRLREISISKMKVQKDNEPKSLNMKEFKSFKYINNFSERYLYGRTVGQGMLGKVCECKLIGTKLSFSVKIMSKLEIT